MHRRSTAAAAHYDALLCRQPLFEQQHTRKQLGKRTRQCIAPDGVPVRESVCSGDFFLKRTNSRPMNSLHGFTRTTVAGR